TETGSARDRRALEHRKPIRKEPLVDIGRRLLTRICGYKVRSHGIGRRLSVMQEAEMRSKRSGAVSIARNVGIGLLALTLTCLHSAAHAQSADLVLCDWLAVDPSE